MPDDGDNNDSWTISATIGSTKIRLRPRGTGFRLVVARRREDDESVDLKTWKFAAGDDGAAVAKMMEIALDVAGSEAQKLRVDAERTVARAVAAADNMRPDSGVLRAFRRSARHAVDTYTRAGQRLLDACLSLERQAAVVGLAVPERAGLPPWVEQVIEARRIVIAEIGSGGQADAAGGSASD